MVKVKVWISAARLRTLPLSVSGILMGGAAAYYNGYSNTLIFVLALATTLALQILSNFANDYGDGVKGTDNEKRVGPQRVLQSGKLTREGLKQGIIVTVIITLLLALLLIYVSFGSEQFLLALLFFVLAVASVWAAIKYTVGKSAYGYRGLGDVFVFVFFGLLSVVGTNFLFTKTINPLIFLPAVTVGFLSTAVLNLNNMRDIDNDKQSGKHTLVVKLGLTRAKKYHFILIIGAFVAMLLYLMGIVQTGSAYLYFCLVAFVPLFVHLKKVVEIKIPSLLDPELKKVALSTFLLAVLFLVLVIV